MKAEAVQTIQDLHLTTAFSPQVHFLQNFELMKPLRLHHTPPSSTTHLCPISHSLPPHQPPGSFSTSLSLGGCPSLTPNQQSPRLAQTNPIQLIITFTGKKTDAMARVRCSQSPFFFSFPSHRISLHHTR